jgi:hypothetical protein
MGDPPQLGADDVIHIASKLTIHDKTFVIGGQAVNLWAWFYRGRHPYLASDAPFTSQDIDYFGDISAAKRFAEAVGGTLVRPDGDTMNTSQTALVRIELRDQVVTIDFLGSVIGVGDRELRAGISELVVTVDADGPTSELRIPVMHPVLCVKSRIGNMLSPATRRNSSLSQRQLEASIAVLEVYLDEVIADGDSREMKVCLKALYTYLRSHEYGRVAHRELQVDLLSIIRRFADDERLDARYRRNQIAGMLKTIEQRRRSMDARRYPQC